MKPLMRGSRFAGALAAAGVLSISLFASARESSAPSRKKSAAPPAPAAVVTPLPTPGIPILPPDKITAGMKGYGFSDLGNGKGVQRFEVEILGVLKRYAPRQDLVLARVSGAGLENSGIIAGMSGSPVYVEEKLVGALAYGWPFSKDAICGITPIQSMLDIRHAPAAPPIPIGGASSASKAAAAGVSLSPGAGSVSTADLIDAFTTGHFAGRLAALMEPLSGASTAGEMAALPLPVSFRGVGPATALFDKFIQSARWVSVPSGASNDGAGSSAASGDAARLKPGSAIAAQLLSGDMDLSATGTVTWVEGNSLLAFGHPFLSMGPV
ncbi:MAG TPA: SpoIVB peptidase S55 domain-containing protein, partial [Thermoanaerobaculia bacterium]